MKTALFIYLFIGIVFNLLGPLARKIRGSVAEIREPSLSDLVLERDPVPSWKKVAFEVILRALAIVFYPILYLVLLYDYYQEKSQGGDITPIGIEDNYLYFSIMGGAGTIHCNVCDFSQDIVSFLHGFGEDPWSNSGYQCQQCGKFHEIERDTKNAMGQRCECGGNLEREMPLFCPKCKTKDVSYGMSYIT